MKRILNLKSEDCIKFFKDSGSVSVSVSAPFTESNLNNNVNILSNSNNKINVNISSFVKEGSHDKNNIDYNKENDAPKIVKCQGCNKSFLEEKIQLHYKKCKNYLTECKYCHLNISNLEVKEHEYVCGSRTDICFDCNSIVKIRELEVHSKFLCKKRKKANKV